MKFFLDLLPSEWDFFDSEPEYRRKQVAEWIFKKRVFSFSSMTNLSLDLRKKLAENYQVKTLELIHEKQSIDGTRKFLWQLYDGHAIETVLIPATGSRGSSERLTLCVSTQVGCALGCHFCASGLLGFKRNLSCGEIVEQVLLSESIVKQRVSHIVFMGMGEPLLNYDQLIKSIRLISSSWGIGISPRKITISTSGIAPRIRKLAFETLPFRLAVSLHATTDELRSKIMPINSKYPLSELIKSCEEFCSRRKQKITLEYILISGLNDRREDAERLARIATSLRAKVNLIPYNPIDRLAWKSPDQKEQLSFFRWLKNKAVQVSIRKERGRDIDGACGQLRLRSLFERSNEPKGMLGQGLGKPKESGEKEPSLR
ncbi:23S rRNA (adenine(2503)-C(2))-methyltransferase RlmN [Candidatus Methylacidiphilum infernorum]|uniref:Probable dual-specificity RNA methyltransferase RlmN n=1 Tax=Candidatus Methylacidiphilum infernorum TaxID=511746 RepID=A0ABX7PSY7_9BACT|nr:23S rRNA (adenine(2503)-C(2))-methyltransferase RlmN [Candidatus Methylacidiphilum infernorum]QSR86042.1 23S rRNA (adenine(2503)-C(2))-methyltransferase RlmN [Candidatus Methylacidiphilum infernorum]